MGGGAGGGSRKALKIAVACSFRLEARVECVLEALAARGHAATLHTGESAREALRATDVRSLRVLLLPERLDPEQLRTLELGLDPDRVGNLLVTTIDRSAPDMAERIESFARVALDSRPKRPPVVRLAEATPVPKKSRKWAAPLAVAAVVVAGSCVALQYGLQPREKQANEPAAAAEASVAPTPSMITPLRGSSSAAMQSGVPADADPITVSVQMPVPDEEIEIFEIDGERRKRVKKPKSPVAAPTHTPAKIERAAAGPIADAPALGPTGVQLGLAPSSPRRELSPPGEEQSLH